MPLLKASEFGDTVDSHQFCLFLFENINTTRNRDSELITEFTTQPQGYGKTPNPIEPKKSQQRVISGQHILTENINVESENPFRYRTIAILINDTMTKSLDNVSCADCSLDPEFPSHEPNTITNCNPIFGRRFGILLEHNNKATFHARTVINCELMHLYSIGIEPASIGANSQHSSAIIDNILPFGFPCHMWKNISNYLLEKSGILDSLPYTTREFTEIAQC